MLDATEHQTPQSEGSAIYKKFGEASLAGFQAVPDVLFKNQKKLGLSATDLTVLLNVLMHWWYVDKMPYPRATTIAGRMGVSGRTVQRSLSRLEALGFLLRETDESGLNCLNPAPLVARLNKLVKFDKDYLYRKALRDGEEGLSPNQHPPG